MAGRRLRYPTRKDILLRCARENRAVIDIEGQRGLDALPDTFREWHQRRACESQTPATRSNNELTTCTFA